MKVVSAYISYVDSPSGAKCLQ